MTRRDAAAFAAGVVFAVGLGIAGMTQPAKVIAFLDVAGGWDPSLALVMLGAIAVHAGFTRGTTPEGKPRFAAAYAPPVTARIDRRLLAGAALFGIGWGAAGLCPGPAVVSLAMPRPSTLAFFAAMAAGMALHAAWLGGARGASGASGASGAPRTSGASGTSGAGAGIGGVSPRRAAREVRAP